MENLPSRAISRLTLAIGIVAVIGLVAISLFFAVGGFWGPLNDLSIAIEAILCALLAWMLHPVFREWSPRSSQLMLLAALAGGVIVSMGSAFVIFKVTGYFLAGLIMFLGYAFIGLWVLALNYHSQHHGIWPPGLTRLGQVAGAIMTLGWLSIPGILGGVDSPTDASWMENLSQGNALGWMILLPIWCFWLSRILLKSSSHK
ncbi:MAG: hypothetical protein AABZ00_14030 [Chloroflexota bacterium]